MTATAAVDYAAPEVYTGPRCQACDGPCWQWKGNVWGYTCTACIERHLAESAAKGAERDRRDRQKLARKRLDAHDDNDYSSVDGGRRGGAGTAAMCRSAAPTSRR
ncbi:hypothetical protein [Mycolicibacterium monacense]|uniref:Uncharacterized protein n=1 Tax=Mycolicibacterium monacense TaxID=85693 RepID=A0AAD1J1A4_MYCMB|nr:hypothetical protein [Mycolicibacterium monacense]MDA4101462.1 hypothetical protein [Mycolicibacterium monacense DSM 44395]ORB20487.1 hypothetical protein BST34_11995 [Mycolicibacterium monacense DSM 44395]QHP88110.1 hypothetical protein EWR22_23690 [Mycolicibacterium monacense DSM 44395]BBZ64514.1 hypothetical protein MMON_58150 [Mycolicibacterium monacense]